MNDAEEACDAIEDIVRCWGELKSAKAVADKGKTLPVGDPLRWEKTEAKFFQYVKEIAEEIIECASELTQGDRDAVAEAIASRITEGFR